MKMYVYRSNYIYIYIYILLTFWNFRHRLVRYNWYIYMLPIDYWGFSSRPHWFTGENSYPVPVLSIMLMRRTKTIWGWLIISDHHRWRFQMFFIFTPGKMIQFDLRIFFRWVGTRPPPPSHQFVGDPSWMACWMIAGCKACARMLILLLVRETRVPPREVVMWFDTEMKKYPPWT